MTESPRKRFPFARPRFRFGLKSLFVVATAVAAFFAYLVPLVREAEQEKEAIDAINAYYPTNWEPDLFSIYGFSDEKKIPSDEFKAPPWLQDILGNNIFMSVNTAYVRGLPSVENNSSGPEGEAKELLKKERDVLRKLSNFQELDRLTILDWKSQSADGFAELAGIRELYLSGWSELIDLSGLAGHEDLERFAVSARSIRSIEPLSNCRKLKYLNLRGCVSLKSIEAVEDLQQLSWLQLQDCSHDNCCLLYTSPSPRDQRGSRMPSSA